MDSSNASLQLDFVYGYHGTNSRDNLFYIETGEVVYHIAGVGIVYDAKTHKQRFFVGHTDDIISLTLHPNKRYVATGQIGKEPYIAIWDAVTMETVSLIKGFHSRGICALGFSNDGSTLVSVGLDDDHTIAFWDWKSGRVISSDKSSKDRIFDIQPSPYSNLIVTGGVKHIKFWKYSGNSLIQKKGVFGKLSDPNQTVLVIAFGHEDGKTYTGTLNGEVLIWQDNTLEKVVKAHKGPVYAVTAFDNGFLTGGKDGSLKVWTKSFEPVQTLPLKYNIRSVSFDNGKILVGTKTSEILEVVYNKDSSKVSILTEGHAEGELWGLAVHPSGSLFVTASDDKMIKMWDASAHKCNYTIQAKLEARSCGFAPDGKHFAVGFFNGSFNIYATEDGKEVTGKHDRKEELSVVKFSPDGKYLAVGSHDNFVDIYDTSAGYSKIGTLSGSSSFITHLDWSVDSKLVQTNSGAYEILYYDISNKCQRITKLPANTEWYTWTAVLGKDVEGIWPPYSDKTDVNTIDRNKSKDLVVTGDDFGFVKLFKYPVPKGAPFKQYSGHSAHVTSVRWSADNSFVISTGGGDQAVLQWKVVGAKAEDVSHLSVNQVEEYDSDIERENEIDYDRKDKPANEEEDAPKAPSGGLFQLGGTTETVHSGRPSLGSRSRATTPAEKPAPGKSLIGHVDSSPAPPKELEISFIHGYRGYDTRNNLFPLKSGEIVYHIAAVGVVYNPKTNTQRIFAGHHTDDIISLTLHPDGRTVATGQVGKNPEIIVWDSQTNEKIAVLQGHHERGVCALSFSPDGTQLLSVGLDDKHTIVLWNWRKGIKLASGNGSQDKIMVVAFNPYDGQSFVTCGVKHVNFWKSAGNGLISQRGIFGDKGTIQTVLSIAFDKEFTYTGTNSGDVYKWSKNTLAEVIPAHKGPVFDLGNSGTGFITGGKDGLVKLWDSSFKNTKTIDLKTKEESAVVKSINSHDGKALVGTRDGSIIEVDEKSGDLKVHINGHGLGELWGLGAHPSKPQFVTASDDKNVKVWDLTNRKLIASSTQKFACRSVAYSPDGSTIAVGYISGGWSVLNADNLQEIASHRHRKEAIHEIKFSPDGKYLAVGSHDNFVDLYETSGKWNRVGTCSGGSSYITHVDWSADSQLIVVNTGAYEQLFYTPPKGSRVTVAKKAVHETNWATWTGVLGDHVAGIWPKYSDGTDINSVDRAKSGDVLASGDDFGFVKIFSYPCPEGSKGKQYSGHSAHVTNVRFSHDDSYLISVGGADTSIIQWKYKQSAENSEAIVEEQYDSDIEREKNAEYVSRSELIQPGTFLFQLTCKDHPIDDGRDNPTIEHPATGGLFQIGGGSDVVHAARNLDYDAEYHDNDNNGISTSGASHGNSLALEYIHGYRGHDARNNLWYISSHEIVYHAAATGVVLDTKTNKQKHYLEHTDDIVSLAYHSEANVVATGQVGKNPLICVWDPKTMKTESILKGFHKIAVVALSFSKNGKMLVSVDDSDNHQIAVWKWKEGIKVASVNGSKEKIFDISFNPFTDTDFVSIGVRHVSFWKLAGTALDAKRGVFGNIGTNQTMLCVAFASAERSYTGSQGGEIYEWNGNTLAKTIKAHPGPVFTINPAQGGDFLSGGKDETVFRWPNDFSSVKETISLPKGIQKSSVRAVTENESKSVLVGTSSSRVIEISGKNSKVLTSGHADGELWGLAVHPNKALFATASDDATLRVWDVSQRNGVAAEKLPHAARSVEYSPDGKLLAVGFANGSFGIYDSTNLKEIAKKRNRKEAIHEIKFSPDGKHLAVGSHDKFVDIYSTSDYKLVGTCKGNSSYITHLDWSKDGSLIHTNSGAYEHLVYDAPSGKQNINKSTVQKLDKPEEWATYTGVLGANLEGIWPKNSDKTDINTVDLTKDRKLIATGDDFGFVKLLTYPSPARGADFKKYVGHSAHVTNVRWTSDDNYLISIGGGDRSIFQWKSK